MHKGWHKQHKELHSDVLIVVVQTDCDKYLVFLSLT